MNHLCGYSHLQRGACYLTKLLTNMSVYSIILYEVIDFCRHQKHKQSTSRDCSYVHSSNLQTTMQWLIKQWTHQMIQRQDRGQKGQQRHRKHKQNRAASLQVQNYYRSIKPLGPFLVQAVDLKSAITCSYPAASVDCQLSMADCMQNTSLPLCHYRQRYQCHVLPSAVDLEWILLCLFQLLYQ